MIVSSRRKITLGVLAGLALIAVTVVAATVPGAGVATTEQASSCAGSCADCTAQCADCPAAKTGTTGACEAQACATVVASRCIGCGRCVAAAPEAFAINPQTGKAEIKAGAPADAIARGVRACPVGAIAQ